MRPLRSLALLLLAPLTLAAQPVPRAACPLPRVVTAAPLAGQPADVAVTEMASSVVQPVTVQDSAGLRCLGYAERVAGASKVRWRAWRTERDGFVRLVARTKDSAWSARADAVRAIIATRPAPVVIPAPVTVFDSALGVSVPTAAAVRAMGPAFAAYDSVVAAQLTRRWAADGAKWESTQYDRAMGLYALCARHGAPVWCARADSLVLDYRTRYLVPNNFGPAAHWAQPESQAVYARRHRDAAVGAGVARMANGMWIGLVNVIRNGEGADPRYVAYALQAQVEAHRLAADGLAPGVAPETYFPDAPLFAKPGAAWADHVARIVAYALAKQTPEGVWSFGSAAFNGGQFNFMAALLHHALIAAHTSVPLPDSTRAAIVAAVARGVGYQWATQWSGVGFQYSSTSTPTGGTEVTADLNGLFPEPFAWLARETGDGGWRTRGDAVFAEIVPRAQWDGFKQANQATATSWRYPGWR